MATKLLVGCDKAIGCSPERGGDDEIVFEIAVNASMLQRDVGIPMIRANHRRKFKQMLDAPTCAAAACASLISPYASRNALLKSFWQR